MENIKSINEHLFAIDNLIDDQYFADLSKTAHNYLYNPTNKDDPSSIWHFNGKCNPFISQNIVWTHNTDYREVLKKIPGITLFPTNTILDELISKIHEIAIKLNIYGDLGQHWVGSLSSIYKYDNGKKLIWHTDSHNYTGAFTYYLHDIWKQDWGGYFLYKNVLKLNEYPQDDGGFLYPSPNRLVLLKSPLLHSISPVTTPTEEYSRIALTGFFVKPDRVVELLSRFTNYHSIT